MNNNQNQPNQPNQPNQLKPNQQKQNNDLLNNSDEAVTQFSEWSPDHEKILVEWADKAMCYRWLHSKSHSIFASKNAWYTIPVIIISTLTGTANFAQNRVPIEYQGYFTIIVGAFSILAGIITTIQQFLKITQLTEAHRVSSIAWDKSYRNIKTELAKHPTERIPVLQMLKMCKEEFDRLMETSPSILDVVIEEFKTKFALNNQFDEIAKPEICDVMIGTEKYRNPWYNDENRSKEKQLIIDKTNKLSNDQKKHNESSIKIVNDFKRSFTELNNRQPLESEIIGNLKDSMDLIILKTIIDKQKNDIELGTFNKDLNIN